MSNLTLASLFDGSGGFPLAGLYAGITPVWASEIEPFPIRVTTKRMPFVKHYGDVSKINGAEVEPVDIITFGSPCQDMSIAGKRAGLDGSRSNLFYEAVRIVKEMREATNGEYPKYILWENVTGAFSSNKGEDFKAVLDEIRRIKEPEADTPRPEKWPNAGCVVADNYSVAWRVLDAQYWGVPQRRKRIFLVADFTGQRAGKILFESEGLSGYSAESFRERQGAAGTAEEGADIPVLGIDGYNGAVSDKAATLGVNCGMSTGRNGVMVLNDQGGNRMDVSEDKTSTLRAHANHPPLVFENHGQDTRFRGPLENAPTVMSTYGTGGNNQPFVVEKPKTFDVRFTSLNTKNKRHNVYETDTSRTIDTGGSHPESNQGGVAVVSVQGSMIGRKDENGPQGSGVSEDVSFTLNTIDRHAVALETFHCSTESGKTMPLKARDYKDPICVTEPAYGIDRSAFNQGKNALYKPAIEEEVQPTMVAKGLGAVAQPYGFYPQMKAECVTMTENKSVTLVNGTNPGYQNGVIETDYRVRRLTPTECARLQGFPDWWCSGLETEEPTDDDIAYWKDVFMQYSAALGNTAKPKTDEQIRKWLKNPHSDSAEYKMWGNGIALPCAFFILCGIVYYTQ